MVARNIYISFGPERSIQLHCWFNDLDGTTSTVDTAGLVDGEVPLSLRVS